MDSKLSIIDKVKVHGTTWLSVALVISSLGVLVFWILRNEPLSYREQKLIIVVFLSLFLLMCFGVLRLYKAVVGNSSYLLTLQRDLKTYDKGLSKVVNTLDRAGSKIDKKYASLEKSTNKLAETSSSLHKTVTRIFQNLIK